MNELQLSLALMLLLFAILGSGVWIALALAVCGFAAVLTKVATPRRALERNEEAICHWKKVTWPDIKKKPKQSGERSSFSTKAD